jgi:hypothetical protein
MPAFLAAFTSGNVPRSIFRFFWESGLYNAAGLAPRMLIF